jgi:hypothetical protein
MNTATPTLTATLLTSTYGTPQPTLEVSLPRTAHHRELAATLYDLAARIERATPASERWVVEVQRRGDTIGRVVLEMVEGDEREVRAAMGVLRKVVG